jgi:hypothetical protein
MGTADGCDAWALKGRSASSSPQIEGSWAPLARTRARLARTAKPSRDKGMKSIRLKITIHLNGNHALSAKQLNALKPPIEKGIAASLPDHIAIDAINVTKVVEMRIREQEGAARRPTP